jgi:hypothetical protein
LVIIRVVVIIHHPVGVLGEKELAFVFVVVEVTAAVVLDAAVVLEAAAAVKSSYCTPFLGSCDMPLRFSLGSMVLAHGCSITNDEMTLPRGFFSVAVLHES